MSLLKQKKEHDRIAAELAAKAKEEAILRELAIHPVVKAGCDRDVRDAYFHGLVFAAIADDEKVDADERAILDGFANSMGLGEGEVEDTIALIMKMSVDDKLQLIEECVCAIKDRESIVKLFYAQFMELWMTGEYDLGELKEYVGMFKDWSGVELPSAQMKNIKAVVSNSAELDSALDDLATWMGNDELKHFALHRYGDVTSRIKKSQNAKRAAEVEKKRQADEARRVQEVFESGPVKQLFSEWERLCGAYSKILPALTYQLQQACRNCVRGIVLPRNYLKAVALKFISGSDSPSFQERGEDEWVKDRGAVLGIFLLHCIRYPYSDCDGEVVEDLNQICQLAQRQSIQDRLVAHVHKYLEIEC